MAKKAKETGELDPDQHSVKTMDSDPQLHS
jgi:hypothetical protein